MMTSSGIASFDRLAFDRALAGCSLGKRLQIHQSVPSTMALADEILHTEGGTSAHGTIVLAESQTAGVGRRGRSWQSAQGNLYFSLIWAPKPGSIPADMLPELVRLNLATGVAVVGAVAAAGFPGARIKWPNDVYHGDPLRKLSGMCEAQSDPNPSAYCARLITQAVLNHIPRSDQLQWQRRSCIGCRYQRAPRHAK